MRSVLHSLAALVAAFFMLNGANAQPFTITNHFELDSCMGGINFQYTTQQGTGLTMRTYTGDGNFQTHSVSGSKGGFNYVYATPGVYTVKHVLMHNGNPVDSVTKSISINHCIYKPIRIYFDNNGNCVNNNEPYYYGSGLMVEIDSAGVKIDTVNVTGSYSLARLTFGQTYTFRLLNTPLGTSATCPTSGSITTTINMGNQIEFGLQCGSTTAFDLHIPYLVGRFRPVNNSYIYVTPANLSCSGKNATLTVSFSSKYSYSSANPTPSSVSGNVVTWNISNLSAQSLNMYTITLNAGSSVSLGDTICYGATITPITGDAVTFNNTVSKCDSVVSSFDPNSKEASPKPGPVFPGQRVEYTINFENLGNDTAFNIHILDTLSALVNASSFEMLSSSHAASPTIIEGAGGAKILRFDLANIQLPDKNSPNYNKGFVKYAINVRPLYQFNALIANRAGIYFDINPVVMTNTTEHRIYWDNVIDLPLGKQLQVYPNPANDVFVINIGSNQFNTYKLLNSLGQTMMTDKIVDKQTTVDVKSLPAGIYYILVSGDAGTVAEKIEKR